MQLKQYRSLRESIVKRHNPENDFGMVTSQDMYLLFMIEELRECVAELEKQVETLKASPTPQAIGVIEP